MITQQRLKELFNYDKDSGIFTRKVTKANRAKEGSIAGSINKTSGYSQIRIDYKLYYTHQLAWLYIYGSMPKQIDHINHDRADNRIENLREVTTTENNQNRSMNTRNTSGYTGVTWNKRAMKWVPQIQVNGKCKGLGYFDKILDAVKARKEAEILYGFHKNHGMEVA